MRGMPFFIYASALPVVVAMFLGCTAAAKDRPGSDASPAGDRTGVAGADRAFEKVGRIEGDITVERPPFSRDGSQFIIAKDDSVQVWSARKTAPFAQPIVQKGLSFYWLSADGTTTRTANDKEVRLWDTATSKLRSVAQVSKRELRFTALSPDGSQFVTIEDGDQQTVALWRSGDAQPFLRLQHPHWCNSAEFDSSGKWIVTHGFGSPYRIWSADTGREACPPVDADDDDFNAFLAQFGPDGRRLVMPTHFGFKVSDRSSGKTVVDETLPAQETTHKVRFSADGRKIAIVTWDGVQPGAVRIYNPDAGRFERAVPGSFTECEMDATAHWALCKSWDDSPKGLVELWDLRKGLKLQSFAAPSVGCHAAFGPDGMTVLIASEGVTDVWRLRTASPATRP